MKDNLKRLIGRRLFQPIEESNAWKNGKTILKKVGATKEDLIRYKKKKKLAVKDYKTSETAEILKEISNKLKQ